MLNFASDLSLRSDLDVHLCLSNASHGYTASDSVADLEKLDTLYLMLNNYKGNNYKRSEPLVKLLS